MKKITAVVLCITIFLITSLTAFADCDVVAIMYHNILNDKSRFDDYTISPKQLEDDINYFMDNGYITMTASELADTPISEIDGKKILLLTFDDGYIGWYNEVFPILKRTGAKATMFIIGAYVNRYGYMSEDEIYELANSSYVEIGNHTNRIHHMPFEVLKNVYNNGVTDDVVSDLKENTKYLEKITGKKITSISWPYGYTTETLDNLVKTELGYKISFNTQYGINKYNGDASKIFNRMNREHSKTPQRMYEQAEKLFN